MSGVLDGEISRPASFDADNDYALVLARAGEQLGDYDLIDLQRIQRHDQAVAFKLLFAEGGVQFETGGTIAPAVTNGVTLGGDGLVSGGTYRGIESLNYIVSIVTIGVAGVAAFTWRSTGSDSPVFAGETVPITAIAASVQEALDNPGKYAHALGTLGVTVSFVNANGILNASSWVVQVSYGARPPTVQKATPDAAHDRIRCYDIVSIINGRAHRCAEAVFDVGSASTESTTIFGEWTRSVVTHVDDPNLRDPEGDTPQAWRERWRLVYRIVDTSELPYGSQELERRVFPLYKWDRATNVVTKVQQRPYSIDIGGTQGSVTADRLIQVDTNVLLQGLLAARTADANGSFVAMPRSADGARARLSTNTATPGKIRLELAPSIVYVEGLKIEHPLPFPIEVDEASEFATVLSEQSTYAGSAVALNKSVGERVFPIRGITLLQAHVQVGTGSAGTGAGYEPHTHATGVDDVLAHPGAVALLVVSANADGTSPFTAGSGANQYALSGGTAIHWGSLANGTVFYVSYRYNATMTENIDYVLNANGSVDFNAPPGGLEPVAGGIVSRNYQYFLPRVDAIIVRSNGDYQVVRGIAAEVPQLPAIPGSSLRYVRVELSASAGGPVTLVPFGNDAITMEQLNRMLAAIDELTRNFAIADLFGQARSKSAGNFLDILCDDFATTDLADQTYNTGGITYDALIDTESGELTLPFTATPATPARVATSLPAGETAPRVGGVFYTLPFTDELAIDSSEYSQAYPVNPYADFTPAPAETRVVPDQDFFEDISARTSTEIESIRKTRALKAGLISPQEVQRLIREFRARNGRSPRRRELLGNLAPEFVSRSVENIPARFMRSITLTLTGTRYVPGEKIRCKFDGKDVTLLHVPAAPGSQGTGGDSPAIVAAADTIVGGDVTLRGGDWAATFVIPVGVVPVGTRLITIYGNQGLGSATWSSATPEAGGYVVRATLPFTSDGVERSTVTQERQVDIIMEPVAQSVAFPEQRMISWVNIPFAAKPANGAPPVVLDFRATDRSGNASVPVETVLEQLAKEASQINVGPSSSNVFVPSDPVLCFADEFRSLVLRSASDGYQIYASILGAAAIASGGTINEQQIPGGIFMDSANNRDWTLHQGWDLRLQVKVAKFSGTVTGVTAAAAARVYYEQIALANLTGFTLNVDQALPDGTAIDWEFSTDGLARNNVLKVWQPFVAFVPVELAAATGTLDLRATLRTDSLYVTPGIHQQNLSVLLTVNKTSLLYVTKRKDLTTDAGDGNHHIKGEIEMIEAPLTPTTTTKVYVSVDGGAASPTWSAAATINGGGLTFLGVTADGFSRYSFDFSGFVSAEKKQLRLRIEGGTPDRAQRPRIRQITSYMTPA